MLAADLSLSQHLDLMASCFYLIVTNKVVSGKAFGFCDLCHD